METSPKVVIIGLLIGTIIVLGGMELFNAVRKENSDFMSSDEFGNFNRTFDQYSSIEDTTNSMKGSIESSSTGTGIWGVVEGLINSVWGVIKNIFTSLSFLTTIVGGMSHFLGIPVWFGNIILLMVTVTLIFWAFTIIFQRA